MRLKLLLLISLLCTGILNAQDTIRSLVITEIRLTGQGDNYIELTNMGDQPINLNNFKLGTIRPWNSAIGDVNDASLWVPDNSTTISRIVRLPDHVLQPGESWMATTAYDYGPEQHAKKIPTWENSEEKPQKAQMYALADMLFHVGESSTNDPTDSITRNSNGADISFVFENWNGRECMYIQQMLDNDSIIIDQAGGVFDVGDGTNAIAGMYDVAGVTGATGNSVLVRKFSVKKGNPDFYNARGTGAGDSEWIPIQYPNVSGVGGWGQWRDAWWTVKNHGDYKLDESTLVSDVAEVDFGAGTITVPWGTRRGDGVMRLMEKKPGVAWIYNLNPNYEDSLTFAACTGDVLTVIVCGTEGYRKDFDIIVSDPTADANMVLPVANLNYPATATQYWRMANQVGILGWPRVTAHDSGVDSITGAWYGIPYSTRVDSLIQRLEKPSNASWEIVWVDGTERPDFKNGDKLKVTSQSGSVKEYFIQVQPIEPSHDAGLSAITWPDIPEWMKGVLGWTGDTIPGFGTTVYNYRLEVPLEVSAIPALVAKTSDLNATVAVKRAQYLEGNKDQRTISFTVTAEDDSVVNVYNIELIKEKDPTVPQQPYLAEPFLSEYVFQDQWNNGFVEICNPGNLPIDLSNYMIVHVWGTYTNAIEWYSGDGDWGARYYKYIPGYKWVDETQWGVAPGTAVQDLNVSPYLLPGDVFVAGQITNNSYAGFNDNKDNWWAYRETDVFFNTADNPWNETYGDWGSAAHQWIGVTWYMFKITNDSIKMGLKPANDPNDFVLIETFGNGEGAGWNIGGRTDIGNQRFSIRRKADYVVGKPGYNESFGTNADDTEWIVEGSNDRKNLGYPSNLQGNGATLDLGQHFFNPPTFYMSTVTSPIYKVSQGSTMNESILGLRTGTTAATFLSNIVKADENQTLKLLRGGELGMDDVLLLNDTLSVMSADSTNTTKYILDVTDEGLSSNAELTSSKYTITIDQNPKSGVENENAGSGNVQGFDYGTSLRTLLTNITVPTGASLTVIDGNGAYVPLLMLNFDTAVVNVTVNDNIYLDVVAEDGVTEIVYQLIPSTSENDAFVLSDIYNVKQSEKLIEYVPRGTTVSTLFSNLVPSAGATMKLLNKMGQERIDGDVADDDKLVVTSRNKEVSVVYYISKLSSAATPETNYLAYILSNTYVIDQVEYKVIEVAASTSISDFLNKISPAPGATAKVVDESGADKTSGTIARGDKVKVTSKDGKIVVNYAVDAITSSPFVNDANIEIYPNPTTGKINISGVEIGNVVQVYNSVGAMIRNFNVQRNIETVSLDNEPAGMYMVVVKDNTQILGRYKTIKR